MICNLKMSFQVINGIEVEVLEDYCNHFSHKRKLNEAFGPGNHDDERYGQTIKNDYFEKNIGHNVIVDRFYSIGLDYDIDFCSKQEYNEKKNNKDKYWYLYNNRYLNKK
jgi:hypothetical protein